MARNIVIVLIGFFILLCSGLLISAGLESMAYASTDPAMARVRTSNELIHSVKSGENLYRIAEIYYGDAELWHRIAYSNNISDPKQLQAGDVLTIPIMPEQPEPTDKTPETTPTSPLVTPATPEPTKPVRALFGGADVLFQVDVDIASHDYAGGLAAAVIRAFVGGEAGKEGYAVEFVTKDPATTHKVYRIEFPKNMGKFLKMYAADWDKDGDQEVYTVWGHEDGNYITKVFSMTKSGPAYTEALENEPFSFTGAWESSE